MYHNTSKGIAALGRNGDDTLLHVKKDELAGLEALLGPVTVNPNTGLPEAFSWTDILTSLGLGIAGALTGGAAAPALGAVGGTLVGAGTGAVAGGALSSLQGKGFMPGALGGAISGGMGAFGATDLEGGPTAVEAAPPSVAKTIAPESNLIQKVTDPITGKVIPPSSPVVTQGNYMSNMEPPSALSDYTANLGKQWGAMTSKGGMEDLLKPIGLGTMLGYGATSTAEQANTSATQMRQEKLKQAIADKQQKDYFASLGFDLPQSGTSWSPDQQRSYFDKIIYGAAAGGPIELSRIADGVPVNTTIPPKYVSQFEKSDVNEALGPALERMQGVAHGIAQQIGAHGFATGGYVNTQPFNPQEFYPQSRIPSAQPYAAAANTGVVNTIAHGASFAEGGSAYEKGGFLDGPGDGMSDDIPASIDGREEIRLADGEFVVTPEMVKLIGGGDPEKGKKLLDNLLPIVRQAAHGKKQQIKQDAGKLAAEKLLVRKGHAGRSGIEAAG